MNVRWIKPTTLGLSEKLKEVNEKLRDVIPLIVEAQSDAIENMAKTAIAAERAKLKTAEEKGDE